MNTKIKRLIALGMLLGASLTVLFALPNAQPNNAQTEPQVTVPSIVSTSGGNTGMHTRADTLLPSVRYGSHIDPNQASVTLDRLDIRSVTIRAPNQIGVNRSVAVSPTMRAQKFVNSDGSQIIVLIIKSSGASGIGIHFRNFALARDEEVYVYGPAADSIVGGPFANKGPWGSGEFWSGTLDGDTAIIEFYTRTAQSEKAFEIFEISHIFPELGGRLRPAEPDVTPLPCEVDASCYPNSLNNSVARIVFNDPVQGPSVCTGTLLADCAHDLTPYFLTANHCVSTQAIAQSVEVYWFYQTTSCGSGVLRSWVHWMPPVANLLANQSSNDFSLLRLMNNPPSGVTFSGWTNALQSTGTGVFVLHHPQGYSPPNIPSYLRRASGTITGTANCPTSGLVNGYLTSWTSGTTEHGSSGSGLRNSDGYLVGVASCEDQDTCSGGSSYGFSKFANFYSQIQQYICSSPTPGKYDFNGDGHPDYLLYNASTRQTAIWYLNNNVLLGGAFAPGLPSGWRLVDVADFNGDGHPDYALFNPGTRQTAIWYLNNNVFVGSAYGPSVPSDWSLEAVADFNGDGKPDYLLANDQTGQTAIWYLNNNVLVSGAYGPTLPGGWYLGRVADFNLDGHPDYLLYNFFTERTAIWYLNNNVFVSSAFAPTIGGWALAGATDFNGDRKPDYALFNVSTLQTQIWYLNNNVLVSSAYGPTLPAGWSLILP